MENLELWVRYAQWRFMLSNQDPWPHYCRALREYPSRLEHGELASGEGELGEAVLKYLRGWNDKVRAMSPGPRHRTERVACNALADACQLIASAAEHFCGQRHA